MANRYAHLREPDDELDFHGTGPIRGAEIKRRTIDFIRAAAKRGCTRVRIITGQGRHSAQGPVVKPQVERTLAALEDEGTVRTWRPERLDRGGDGALLVELP